MLIVSFFSSDARQLYKADIFRVLALPDNFIIHFRYQKKYINDDLLNDIEGMIDQEAVIFFTAGNEIKKDAKSKDLVNIPIRGAQIIDIEDCRETGLVHFYLKLRGFSVYTLQNDNPKDNFPPYKFVSKIKLTQHNTCPWIDIIDQIKHHFQGVLFFKINGIKKSYDQLIYPMFNKKEKQSNYNLDEEQDYILNMSFFDNSGGENALQIKDNRNVLFITSPDIIKIGSIKDDRKYRIITHTLDVRETTTFLSFISKPENGQENQVYDLLVPVNIKKTKCKIICFGLVSFLLFGGFILLKFAYINNEINWLYLLLSVVFVSVSSSLLYAIFNKK
ncbi:MAG: hypothetical protein MJA84_11080 [Firmicutes bacterium]|nr:hypothetical protein [Bacillota bacterium]